jgi:flagellar biosynthesis component FlhA
MSRWRVNAYRDFATNAATAVLAVLVSIALQVIAGVFLPAAAPILETLLTAVIAVSVTTYGQQSTRSNGKDKA